ncbi:ATPase involved in chromosome partitioning [gamma proteobacterium HdN1]|nr:ATPase involved in chromosome partitioning [gamma proteobacterium HdN1]
MVKLKAAIEHWQDPYAQAPLSQVADVQIEAAAQGPDICITWRYPIRGVRAQLEPQIADFIATQIGDGAFRLACEFEVSATKPGNPVPAMGGIKNIIAVASGKGGVGKSTTAVNLALALSQAGARVGLLDADIYGPSQPVMVGVPEGTRPEVVDGKAFKPILALGLQTMSIGYLVTESTPMVWRGPMVSGALQQLLTQTLWDALDYLIIDLPPGTGDIQLTLSQKVPVSGAVIVTTPQDIALLDARKGIEMFGKVNVPVLGIVENMSIHICSQCGHQEAIFGEGGGERIASDYHTRVLGRLPLAMRIREQADGGKPTAYAEPDSEIGRIYAALAASVGGELAKRAAQGAPAGPKINVTG